MKNALRSITIAMTLIITFNGTALAAPTNAKNQKNSPASVQAQREAIEMKVEEFDNEIQNTMAKTEENKGKISKTESQIKKSAAEVALVEKQAQREQDLFNSRIRVMYINGIDSYTSIILDSENFGDFISRVDNIRTVIEFDKKVAGEFEATKSKLAKEQLSLNGTKDILVKLQVENKQKMDKLIISKESQTKLVAQLKTKESLLTGKSQISVNSSMTKINSIRSLAPKYTPSRGSSAISDNAIIAYASNFVGTPYLWGGTTPSGFDCSGFTQYVYAHFGVSIGRATFNQINDGTPVSRDNLQTGDLVLFGAANNPHHVGIYIGNNTYIHSPHTGDVIKVSVMSRSDFITGRRVK